MENVIFGVDGVFAMETDKSYEVGDQLKVKRKKYEVVKVKEQLTGDYITVERM